MNLRGNVCKPEDLVSHRDLMPLQKCAHTTLPRDYFWWPSPILEASALPFLTELTVREQCENAESSLTFS